MDKRKFHIQHGQCKEAAYDTQQSSVKPQQRQTCSTVFCRQLVGYTEF